VTAPHTTGGRSVRLFDARIGEVEDHLEGAAARDIAAGQVAISWPSRLRLRTGRRGRRREASLRIHHSCVSGYSSACDCSGPQPPPERQPQGRRSARSRAASVNGRGSCRRAAAATFRSSRRCRPCSAPSGRSASGTRGRWAGSACDLTRPRRGCRPSPAGTDSAARPGKVSATSSQA